MAEETTYVSDEVLCDSCNGDFTHSDEQGGILFDSRAICPGCTPRWEASAREFGELDHIKDRCPEGMTFRDWVKGLRGGDGKGVVSVIVFGTTEEALEYLGREARNASED